MLANPKRTVLCGGKALVALAVALLLVGCEGLQSEAKYPEYARPKEGYGGGRPQYGNEERPTIFGPGGLTIFGGSKRDESAVTTIPVNSYLWRASLDTLSFMPLVSADPFGGVIITDWYTPPESASERFKMTVYILTRDLRADGLRVSVFRQLRNGDGTWSDAEVYPATRVDLEDAILTRARELRFASAAQ